ncbi:MAG TPA: DUF2283 domain-containing protein [Bryobacteraceae bacterium]|nr:DUF2283 domain-containing protein [Bryobacteraceae bacterium]
MNLKYDPEADAAYIYVDGHIADGQVSRTYPCDLAGVHGSVNLDFDDSSRLRGIEILGAKALLSAEALRKAELPATPGR